MQFSRSSARRQNPLRIQPPPRSLSTSRREERRAAVTHCAAALPREALPDPIGFVVKAHGERSAKRCTWRRAGVAMGPVDSVSILTTFFRHALRPAEVRAAMRRSAEANAGDDVDRQRMPVVRAKTSECSSAVRLPRRQILLPSRLRPETTPCSQCQRQHVLPPLTDAERAKHTAKRERTPGRDSDGAASPWWSSPSGSPY